MPRTSRTIIPGIPHHITQRGNRRQTVFFSDADRLAYLSLLKEQSEKFGMAVLAYCLMRNHVHLIAIPTRPDSCSLVFGTVHAKYAKFINRRNEWRGHLWQFRFFSSPLDERYFQEATRYVETNPVRAKLVEEPEAYLWSSARGRILGEPDACLDSQNQWNKHLLQGEGWKSFLKESRLEEEETVRTSTERNLPCGTQRFIEALERETGEIFIKRAVGRPSGSGVNSLPRKW